MLVLMHRCSLEPAGTGSIILGTPEFNSDGERVRPSPIMAPILENIPDDFEKINQADLNRSFLSSRKRTLGMTLMRYR